tara:strand:- start:4167 stop:4889 length:723 start_codon:yes stop_codon:yes gene_type:complete
MFCSAKDLGVEGIVVPSNGEKTILKEGDTVNLTLSLWPKDYSFFKKLKGLESKKFLNYFFIVKVYGAEVSKNNDDVFNIYFKAVVLKPFIKDPFYIWAIESKNIPIEIRKISTLKIKNKYDFYIYENLELRPDNNIFLIISFLFVIMLVYLYLKNRKKKPLVSEENRVWLNKIENASTRNDFELLYKNRKEWCDQFKISKFELDEFFKIINKYQYRSYWTEEIRLEVLNCFSKFVEKVKK